MEHYYMVEFELPEMVAQDFLSKLPIQRQVVARLMEEGIIKSYSLSLNRSRLWTVITAGSEFEVMNIIGELPLADFMIPFICPLMYHNTAKETLTYALN